jgi:aldehyde dehydrogenase (NAD+)
MTCRAVPGRSFGPGRRATGPWAAAPTLKHVQLELGGKAAALVLDDAPLQHLIETMMPAMLFNNGQMCLQPGWLVVPEHRKDEIVDAFAEAFAKVVVGPLGGVNAVAEKQ